MVDFRYALIVGCIIGSISTQAGAFVIRSAPQDTPPSKATASDCNAKLAELKTLYKELIAFKDNSDFHSYGFSRGRPSYWAWMERAVALNKIFKKRCFLEALRNGYEVFPGDLINVGISFMSTQGAGDNTTDLFLPMFEKAMRLPPLPE